MKSGTKKRGKKKSSSQSKSSTTPEATGKSTKADAAAGGPSEPGVVQLAWHPDGVAVIRLGAPMEAMITLSVDRMESLRRAVLEIQKRGSAVRGVVVTGPDRNDDTSRGGAMFAAGADIHAFAELKTADAGRKAAQTGQEIFAEFGRLEVPVVAAISGPCLGGGFELALACDVRVAASDRATVVGLPETKLGIVPGFGGTQRLSRLVGLPAALGVILPGQTLKSEPARRKGLVDRVVSEERLVEAAWEEIEKLCSVGRKAPNRRLRGSAFWLSRTPLRHMVKRKAEASLSTGIARFFPAPKLALELCLDAFRTPKQIGFANEAKALGDMIVTPTCHALVHLFFLTERAKKLGASDAAQDVERAVVVGGGAMGAGIAGLMAQRGLHVRLTDLDLGVLAKAKARVQKGLNKRLSRRRMKPHEAQAVQDRLAVSTDAGNLANTDLWLEAVVEDLALKQKLMSNAVASGLKSDAVIATNTSSLPIDAMADAVDAPERVVGVHFFNPPEKMPLVEVIRGSRTNDAAVATACKLALKLGKFPVVVQDRAGFLVNRCLSPYLNEATRLLLEGNEPEAIDRVMLDFGMPMGPCRLLDEVGFDVATKVSEVMHAAFPERMDPSPLFPAMVKAGLLGTKTGGGLFDADGNNPSRAGRTVLDELRQKRAGGIRHATRTEILHRLIYPMIAEAYRCLDEGLVESTDDLDLGLVFGIGFPPFTGGVTRFAESEGLKNVVAVLDGLTRDLGTRFRPADALRRRASKTS